MCCPYLTDGYRLIRELKTYPSDHRLLLTGTPLHNNLAELWSLVRFFSQPIYFFSHPLCAVAQLHTS